VRATVPEGIVAFLNLKAGDKLIWQMEVKDSQRMALVTKKVNVESVEQARHSMKMKRKRTEEDEF
jgi:hypothetical protein